MKHLLLTTIAAVLLVGCGESQQSATPAEATPVEPVAEVPARPSAPPVEAKPVEPVAEAASPEPPTAKAPDISIWDAAEDGNIEVVKQHIAAGTDVNGMDTIGRTPLYFAVFKGHKEIAELLIEKGADVNAKAGFGSTPLHDAAFSDLKEVAIANGADVNVKSKFGETPLDLAIINNETETAAILRKHGAKTGEELKDEGN